MAGAQELEAWNQFTLKFIVSPFVQDMHLEPLASFLQPAWNHLNTLPLHQWLILNTADCESYKERMKALGNIVVPQCGMLGMNLLHRMGGQI